MPSQGIFVTALLKPQSRWRQLLLIGPGGALPLSVNIGALLLLARPESRHRTGPARTGGACGPPGPRAEPRSNPSIPSPNLTAHPDAPGPSRRPHRRERRASGASRTRVALLRPASGPLSTVHSKEKAGAVGRLAESQPCSPV